MSTKFCPLRTSSTKVHYGTESRELPAGSDGKETLTTSFMPCMETMCAWFDAQERVCRAHK